MIKTIKELKLAIDEKMKECNAVVIVPHIGTDCDALASSLAVALIAKKYGRDFVIVMDDEKVESVVSSIIAELPPEIKFVNSKLLEEYLKDKKALYIVVDTNKRELIPIKDIDARDNVIVIDHHDVGESSILTEDKFISLGVSSASEIMFKLLEDMRIKYDSNLQGTELNFNIANYLLLQNVLHTEELQSEIKILSEQMEYQRNKYQQYENRKIYHVEHGSPCAGGLLGQRRDYRCAHR